MIKLLDPEGTSGGANTVTQNVTPADKYTDEELRAMAQSNFYSNPQHGLFRRTLIDPEAAKLLPQTEGAKILGMGKSGLALLGGGSPEFPFAAWARQHEQPMSMNTKMMHQVAEQLKEPEADPRIQRNLDNQFSGFLNDIYKEGESKFGSMQNVNRILSGNYYNESERDWDLNTVHRGMQYFANGANLSKDIAENLDYIDKNNVQVSSDFAKALVDYRNSFAGGFSEDNIKQMERSADELSKFTDIEKLAETYAPKNFDWGKMSYFTSAREAKTDKNGNPLRDKDGNVIYGDKIPYGYTEYKIQNPDGTDASKDFQETVSMINDATVNRGNDLGIKDDEKRKQYIADYLMHKSPKSSEQTLHIDKPNITNVYTGQQQTGTVYQSKGETTTFGSGNSAVTQEAISAYHVSPFSADLGTQSHVISQKTGESQQVDLNDVKIGTIQNRRVKVVNGKIQVTNDTGEDTFIAPMAVAEKPVFELQTDPVTKKVSKVPTNETENYYIPLSYVANIKTTDDNTQVIKNSYEDAMAANNKDANKEANDNFQKYFGMTETDIYKNKKTGSKSTKTTTTNPALNY